MKISYREISTCAVVYNTYFYIASKNEKFYYGHTYNHTLFGHAYPCVRVHVYVGVYVWVLYY